MQYVTYVCVCSVTHSWPTLCDSMDPWTVALQNLLSMEFSRQEYRSDLPFPAAAKSLQSCPTLCDPLDGSPPGSPVAGSLQARTLQWVAISFSNAWKWQVKVKWLSRIRLLATPWTAAHQAPPSMGFSRQEYWSGMPLPSPAISYSNIIYVFSSKYNFSCIPQFMVCITTVIMPVYITGSNAKKLSFPISLYIHFSPQQQNALSNYFQCLLW